MKNYLAHHGVAGQKWGQRHGPPYPLNSNPSKQASLKAKSKSSYNKLYGGNEPSHEVHTMKSISATALLATAIATALIGTKMGNDRQKAKEEKNASSANKDIDETYDLDERYADIGGEKGLNKNETRAQISKKYEVFRDLKAKDYGKKDYKKWYEDMANENQRVDETLTDISKLDKSPIDKAIRYEEITRKGTSSGGIDSLKSKDVTSMLQSAKKSEYGIYDEDDSWESIAKNDRVAGDTDDTMVLFENILANNSNKKNGTRYLLSSKDGSTNILLDYKPSKDWAISEGLQSDELPMAVINLNKINSSYATLTNNMDSSPTLDTYRAGASLQEALESNFLDGENKKLKLYDLGELEIQNK